MTKLLSAVLQWVLKNSNRTNLNRFFASIESKLSGKKIALFGSYEWAGDGSGGEWMRNWETRAKGDGADLFEEGLIIYDSPDASGKEKCKSFGERFAK